MKSSSFYFFITILSPLFFFGSKVFGLDSFKCSKELAGIEYQPPIPALPYLKKLEAEVKKQAAAWFNPLTSASVATNFANVYGIEVHVINALGQISGYPSQPSPNNAITVTYAKSVALNKGFYTISDGNIYYSFPLRNGFGEYLNIVLIEPFGKIYTFINKNN